jgi:hypothetical protein
MPRPTNRPQHNGKMKRKKKIHTSVKFDADDRKYYSCNSVPISTAILEQKKDVANTSNIKNKNSNEKSNINKDWKIDRFEPQRLIDFESSWTSKKRWINPMFAKKKFRHSRISDKKWKLRQLLCELIELMIICIPDKYKYINIAQFEHLLLA